MNTTLKTSVVIYLAAISLVSICRGLGQIVFPEASASTPELRVCPAGPNSCKEVARGDGCLVAVGHDGKLRCSADGIEWQAVYVPTDDFIRGVAFGNGQFVAVGGSYAARGAIILTSRNGRRWTTERCPTKKVLQAVAHGDGRFVAVGADGTILRSENARGWRLESAPTELSLASVAFGKGMFVAGGDDGLLLASPDGTRWTKRDSGTRLYIGRIAFQDDTFLVESKGSRLTSSDTIAWSPLMLHESSAQFPQVAVSTDR